MKKNSRNGAIKHALRRAGVLYVKSLVGGKTVYTCRGKEYANLQAIYAEFVGKKDNK